MIVLIIYLVVLMIWAGGCFLSFLVFNLEKKFPLRSIKVNLKLFTLVVVGAIAGSGFGLFMYSKWFFDMRQRQLREAAHWKFR